MIKTSPFYLNTTCWMTKIFMENEKQHVGLLKHLWKRENNTSDFKNTYGK